MSTRSYGQRLKIARERRGLSQSELARLVGVRPQAIQYLEASAKAKSRYTSRLARVLGVSAHWLDTDEGPMEREAEYAPPTPPTESELNATWRSFPTELKATLIAVVRTAQAMSHMQRAHAPASMATADVPGAELYRRRRRRAERASGDD